jgi:hypothetical protein
MDEPTGLIDNKPEQNHTGQDDEKFPRRGLHALARLSRAPHRVKLPRRLDILHRPFRMEAMDSTLSSRLSMITLPDVDGKELRFGSLWVRQPAVVVFLRHYG